MEALRLVIAHLTGRVPRRTVPGESFWERETRCPVMSGVRSAGRAAGRMAAAARAFTLVELLVVIGIAGVLLGMLMPAIAKSREQASMVRCQANLRSVGQALLIYVSGNAGRLPYVIEPIYTATGGLDFSRAPGTEPQSLVSTLKDVWKSSATPALTCNSARLGYPNADASGGGVGDWQMTYRVSSANNADGQARTVEQLSVPDGNGSLSESYNLKYLNGRKYRMLYVDVRRYPSVLTKGVGPFYLVRDFVGQKPPPGPRQLGALLLPHKGGTAFNQLLPDMSVTLERDPTAIAVRTP